MQKEFYQNWKWLIKTVLYIQIASSSTSIILLKMLRLLVLICLLNYSLCIEPTPCKCECPIYAIDLKIAKDNPCNKPCCSDKRTKFFDSVTARGCGQRNEDPYTVKIKGKNTTADYGS